MEQSADIRWQQRLVSFGKALKLLQEAMLNGPGALNQLEKEGAIQRFEFAVLMPRQVLEEAYAAKTIANGETWIAMLDHRNLLSHTYNSVLFEQVVEAIQERYLPALEQLREFLQLEAMQ